MSNKKVLIISYNFSPRSSASAIRPTSVAKYISDFGWTPIVLTAKNPDRYSAAIDQSAEIPSGLKVETAYSINISPTLVYYFVRVSSLLTRIFSKKKIPDSFASEVVFPDYNVGWIPFCLKKATSIIKEQDIDLVYISCKPFSTAILGYFLKKRFKNIKVVVEFQDPWSVTPYHKHSNLYLKWARATENAIFKKIDLLLVVTKGHEKAYLDEYEWLNVRHVYIGYDKDEFDQLFQQESRKDKFIILHAGTFYLNRNPENLLHAIAELDNDNIEFWNIGKFIDKFQDSFEAYSKLKNIHVYGWLPHREMLKLMGNASFLYLNQARPLIDGPGCISVSAKTFEYLATGLPILADMGEGDNAEIIRSYSDNCHFISDPSIDNFKAIISEAYSAWLDGRWEYSTTNRSSNKFNHRNLVKEVSDIFDQLIED